MPINYNKYPKNWKTEIRPRILKRAKNKCECCGVPNYAVGYRDEHSKFVPTAGNSYHDKAGRGELSYKEARELADHCNEVLEEKYIVIVLTIAHLDHDEYNHNVQDDRLQAMCQACHLKYDAAEKTRRRKNKNQIILKLNNNASDTQRL